MDAKEEIKDVISEVIAEPKFSARGVVRLAFSVFWKNPLLYLILSFIVRIFTIAIAQFTPTELDWIANTLVRGALSAIFTGPAAYGVYKGLVGERVGIGEAMKRGLSHYRSLIGLSIISSAIAFCIQGVERLLGNIGGLIAVVGMAYYFTVYAVITPTCVVERLGATQSFLRGATLTQGYRWVVFRLLFLCSLGIVAGLVIASIVLYVASPSRFPFVTPTPHRETDYMLAMEIPNIIIFALFEVGCPVLYYQLRSLKEGVAIGELERVFE